jgi:hypothetical protein
MKRLPQISPPLRIEPEIRTIAEDTSKDQRSVRSYRTAIAAKLIDMFARKSRELRKFCLAHPKRLQKLLDKKNSGTYGLALRHQHLSSQPSAIRMIVKVNFRRLAAVPLKDQSPAIVHPYRMKTGQTAGQLLEVIAGGYAKIGIARCVVDHLKSAEQPIFNVRRNFSRTLVIFEELAQPLVSPSCNHFRL